MAKRYNPKEIEKKWQKQWEEQKLYQAPDKVEGRENFYHLVMYPYPSGNLHIGHWYNFGPADVYARKKKMEGYNVLSPIGFDAFGLPAENAAIKNKVHPREWTFENIRKMRSQLKSIGAIYDWSREVITAEPDYYRWTQWLFLQFFKRGFVYRKKTAANWCEGCKTVLANEQVINGHCERCDSVVIQREIEQWLFKITAYADRLLKNLEKLDWPERTKVMQENWIGRSEGAMISFPIEGAPEALEVFTTRPDTIFGATYMVLAPEHHLIEKLTAARHKKQVDEYRIGASRKTELERLSLEKGKTGVFTGSYALNPATKEKIPIWVADYVLAHYGTGAIMAVPAHDERDFGFAGEHKLPVIEVISPDGKPHSRLKEAYVGDGVMIRSGDFDGLFTGDAMGKMIDWMVKEGWGRKQIQYKLRDWIISRQRYWGVPIPIIHCEKCGPQAVPEKDLPVLLPEISDYTPAGEGASPLARAKDWAGVSCPNCAHEARRETDTMDTFVDSSWYFLRYSDPRNKDAFAAKEKMKAWLPVDMYIGGAEHAVMHLLYARFFNLALYDMNLVPSEEAFKKLRHQGIILGEDGQKMSKSRGNVVDPDALIKEYGSDTVRMYLCFMSEYSQGGPWNSKGINGISRFLNRVWNFYQKLGQDDKKEPTDKLKRLLHQTVKKVSEDIEALNFNTALSALMVLFRGLEAEPNCGVAKDFLKLLAPFGPHLAEEIWQAAFGGAGAASIHNESWPKFDKKWIEEKEIELVIQVNGRVRGTIAMPAGADKEKARELAFNSGRVKKYIEGKEIVRVVFTGKLINIVVK
jgi:leucyl-tRNA synthetase